MTEEQIQEFKSYFEEQVQRASLAPSVLLEQGFGIDPDDHADHIDYARGLAEQDMKIRLNARRRDQLLEVKYALERIRKGIFGFCEDCDEPIGLGRLKAKPTAKLCVSCKKACESKGRRCLGGREMSVFNDFFDSYSNCSQEEDEQ